ncbi:hypothetical protein BU26DRAFT_565764 [Trematosphaeria pertusa]|uniref:Uncharacterized protein n=1 Tax=Trematosphaeria pertusa TaxID=390896 RepID=A0A6A6ID92_9PLEO|nr:uncharacterized protein BU26DRAFT_565764 [Trematosphaeria pertusa]KAF2248361.1 hypothetical protein BU26DRAFT_565764 [Trematosphaeria pertusa]
MRFSTVFPILASGTSILAAAIAPSQSNTCFDMNKGTCLGHNANATAALVAITNACAKVSACTPGQTGHRRTTVTGIVKGFPYTATLYVGDQCGGVATWSQDACVGLFKDFVDTRCEAQYPAGDDLFELGYQRATCDQSFVSFNFGG